MQLSVLVVQKEECSNRLCKGCCVTLMSKMGNTTPCRAKSHVVAVDVGVGDGVGVAAAAAAAAPFESQVKEGRKMPSVVETAQQVCLPVGVPALPPICFAVRKPATPKTCLPVERANRADAMELLSSTGPPKHEMKTAWALVLGIRPSAEVVMRIGNDDISQHDFGWLDGPRLPKERKACEIWLNDKVLAFSVTYLLRMTMSCAKGIKRGKQPTLQTPIFTLQ